MGKDRFCPVFRETLYRGGLRGKPRFTLASEGKPFRRLPVGSNKNSVFTTILLFRWICPSHPKDGVVPVGYSRFVQRANMPLMMQTDTTPDALRVQMEVLDTLSGEQRMLMAFEISELARSLARARIQGEHPEWPEARIARELLRLAFFPAPLPDWVP